MKKIILTLACTLMLFVCACGQPSEGLEYESNNDGTCTLIGMGTCKDIKLIVPEQSPLGDKVKNIELSGSSASDLVISIESESITHIDYYGIEFMENLESIKMPNVSELEAYAIVFNEKLHSIELGDISYIEGGAFDDNPLLEEVKIGEGLNYYRTGVFAEIYYDGEVSNEDYVKINYFMRIYSSEPEEYGFSATSFVTKRITEENLAFIYCTMFEKDVIQVNGKPYTLPKMKEPIGSFSFRDNIHLRIEFENDFIYRIYYEDIIFLEGIYKMNEETGCYLIESGANIINFTYVDGHMYLYGVLFDDYGDYIVSSIADLTE